MSLNFDLGGIDGWKEKFYLNDVMIPECHNMIFATISAGIGHITEDNYIEFAMRCNVVESMSEFASEFLTNLNPETVRKYIGLRTNVSFEPTKKWFDRHFDNNMMTARYKERQRLAALEKKAAREEEEQAQ